MINFAGRPALAIWGTSEQDEGEGAVPRPGAAVGVEDVVGTSGRLGHRTTPVVVTEAAESQPEQLRKRQLRYVIMMGTRVVCLVAGVVVVAMRPPALALWLTLCIAGMVFLPWMAVLIANDRPPKKASQFRNRLTDPFGRRAIEAAPTDRYDGANHDTT